MTVIAFVVGIVLGVIGTLIGSIVYAMKVANLTLDELNQCGSLLIEAGTNRESTLDLTYDDDFGYGYNTITLKAR